MNKPKKEVYILGHRNPDTDSICSAIAYADLKNREKDGRKVRRASKACGETLRSYVYTKWRLRRGEERGDKFEEIMAENFPDLVKNNL